MYLAETDEIQQLRGEIRAYFAELMPPEVRHELRVDPREGSDLRRRLRRQMGADGWLGIGWPAEYGGQGRGPDAQLVFLDEAWRAGAPMSFVTLNTVGPTLMSYGTDEQKQTYLPRILAGEITFAIGYTEPEAGTDLASLRTRAVRDGDAWVIDGTKVFTSGADGADFIWLACRTDPDAPKHRGISLIIVPTSADGFSVTPIETVGGLPTAATYYDGVRVPVDNLVGEPGGGWTLITAQLNHERVGLAALSGGCQESYDEVVAWAASTRDPEGNRLIDRPEVRLRLAEARARLGAMHLLNWRLVDETATGAVPPGEASVVKVYGSENAVTVFRLLQEVVGSVGVVRIGGAGTIDDGVLERYNRSAQINTFGGGVNEVQREIIGWLALGMARGRR